MLSCGDHCALIWCPDNRFEPIYHIDADVMKPVYTSMREEERQRAVLFQSLSVERTRRRVREWSIRALKERRIQLLKVWTVHCAHSLFRFSSTFSVGR